MRYDSFKPNGSNSHRHNGRKPNGRVWQFPSQPALAQKRAEEDTLTSGTVQIEQKSFVFTLKENPRGRFLRITEAAKGRHNSIMIPAAGFADVKRILDELIKMA